MRSLDIRTSYECPPIPVRDMDYSAVDYNTLDEGSTCGRGRTASAAIADLVQMDDSWDAAELDALEEESLRELHPNNLLFIYHYRITYAECLT